ncbi:MAG TPA: hypothetical protein PK911_05240 [Candidatus Saccharibacteria bacterium]|nr:hypothetical protein [Candidatus Saccharibacteria bacterium]
MLSITVALIIAQAKTKPSLFPNEQLRLNRPDVKKLEPFISIRQENLPASLGTVSFTVKLPVGITQRWPNRNHFILKQYVEDVKFFVNYDRMPKNSEVLDPELKGKDIWKESLRWKSDKRVPNVIVSDKFIGKWYELDRDEMEAERAVVIDAYSKSNMVTIWFSFNKRLDVVKLRPLATSILAATLYTIEEKKE